VLQQARFPPPLVGQAAELWHFFLSSISEWTETFNVKVFEGNFLDFPAFGGAGR